MTPKKDGNFAAFSNPEVVRFYENYKGLQPAETYAFAKYIMPNSSILDVGVGCGRTTPFLAAGADKYVGVDYVDAMINVCRERFPEHSFHYADATNLNRFGDECFDRVVFSFNGIDAIPTIDGRQGCLSEIFRVLTHGGLLIFSSHNSKMLLNLPILDNVGLIRKTWRLARAARRNLRFDLRLFVSGAFFLGAGYYLDPAHGGIRGYCSTPELVASELSSAGFRVVEVIGSLYPKQASRYFTPWYYYVAAKPSVKS
jgi:ubiquinone/menaquinone biosynthesis C-methylase UbiE